MPLNTLLNLSVQDSMWRCEDGTGWCQKWLQPWRLMNLLHWPVRMHIASVGVSKFCFLFSLAFCSLLLLLIPALQPPARQVDLPQPRPQVRAPQAGPSHHAGAPTVAVHAGETDSSTGLNRSSAGQRGSIETEGTRNDNHSPKRGADSKRESVPGGKGAGLLGSRSWDLLEFKDIFIAVKTTRKYHKSRLELLIQTWVSQAKEQVSAGVIYWLWFMLWSYSWICNNCQCNSKLIRVCSTGTLLFQMRLKRIWYFHLFMNLSFFIWLNIYFKYCTTNSEKHFVYCLTSDSKHGEWYTAF